MEQFEAIAENQPVFGGDLISKDDTKNLRLAGLTTRNHKGDHVLTERGKLVWDLWSKVGHND